MSLANWQKNGWLKTHQASKAEIQNLLGVVDRDLKVGVDAQMHPDYRFIASYNAALQTANIALRASGYEATKGGGAHHYTIESLKFTIAADGEVIDALQAFKAKRGGAVYESTDIATESEIDELSKLATELHAITVAWLKAQHPHLL